MTTETPNEPTLEDVQSLEAAILRITTQGIDGSVGSHYNPFYGAVLRNIPIKFADTVPTACIYFEPKSQKFCIDINLEFWRKLNRNERTALLIHEIMHLQHGHLTRYDHLKDPRRRNLAADEAINQHINGLPEGAIYPETVGLPNGKTTDYYYNNQPENDQQQQKQQQQSGSNQGKESSSQQNGEGQQSPQQSGNGKDGNKGKGSSQQQSDGQQKQSGQPGNQSGSSGGGELKPLDEHNWEKKDASGGDVQEMAAAEKKLVEDALETLARGGRSPSSHEAQVWLGEIEKAAPKINWKVELRKFLQANVVAVNKVPTRTRPNKRYGYAAPGLRREELPELWVLIDTSGSVSPKEFSTLLTEVEEILAAKQNKVTLGLWHTSLYFRENIKKLDLDKLKAKLQSGGTDFEDCVKAITIEQPDAIIVLTDGEFADTAIKVKQPILYVLTEEGQEAPPTTYPRQRHIQLKGVK